MSMKQTMCEFVHGMSCEEVAKFLGKIVRCRDCEYSHTDKFGVLRCTGELVEPWDYYNDEPSEGAKITPDGFCAWAVRKGGGDD